MLRFNEFRRNAPHDSDSWATTDRGWAWAPENGARCFAHYLDYRGTSSQGRDGKFVHVVIVDRGVVWTRNCADARLAIRAAYRRARRTARRGSNN